MDDAPLRRPSTSAESIRPKTAGRNMERPPRTQLTQRPPSRLGQSHTANIAASTVTAVQASSYEPRSSSRSQLHSTASTRTSLRTAISGTDTINPRARGFISKSGRVDILSTGITSAANILPFKHGSGAPRSVTQQGVSGIRNKMNSAFGQRQVADKTYYAGVLNSQLNSLQNEIDDLYDELQATKKGRRNLLIYEQRAEEQAGEIKGLQAELSKLNLVIDRQNVNTNLRELNYELSEKQRACESEASALENLFAERRIKEELVQKLQCQIQQIREENLLKLSHLEPSLKSTIEKLKYEKEHLRNELNKKQSVLDELNNTKSELDMALVNSPLKQQALALEGHLRELKMKKAALIDGTNVEGTFEEQRQLLINRIQKDNEEIANMQLQIQEANERIVQAQEEVREFSNEFDIVASDRSQRFRELRHCDTHYNVFLDTFDDAMAQITVRMQELSRIVVGKLRIISTNCELAEFASLDKAVTVNESIFEMNGAFSTSDLQDLCLRLQDELISLEQAEEKFERELKAMSDKQAHIQELQIKLDDLSVLQSGSERQKMEMEKQKQDMAYKKSQLETELLQIKRRTAEIEQLMISLAESNSYYKVRELKNRVDAANNERNSLRKKLNHLTDRNDFHTAKTEAMKLRAEYNALICSMNNA